MKRTKHIYKRFFSLAIGQTFFIRRKVAIKVGVFSFQNWGKRGLLPRKTIAPWRKVRTTQPVTIKHAPAIPPDARFYDPRYVPCLVSSGRERTATEIQQSEYLARTLEAANAHDDANLLRDPMVQDHTPDKPPEIDRNGPAS
jgi:hypothetical protein